MLQCGGRTLVCSLGQVYCLMSWWLTSQTTDNFLRLTSLDRFGVPEDASPV